MPAAHQRSAIVLFCQFFTFVEWLRTIEIIDSMQLVERSVRASAGETPRRSTVSVSVRPSRKLPAAPGMGALQLLGQRLKLRLGQDRGLGPVGRPHPLGDGGGQVIGQLVGDVGTLCR